MSISCVLLQKILILSNREETLKEQQRVLQELAEAHRAKGQSYVAAGGLLKTVDISIGQGEGVAACMLGSFENVEHLATRYLGENFSKNAKLQSPEVICHLYKVFGRVLPQKLKGDFCFLLFDPSQGRVLAAVSPSWKAPLLQARGADGSLIITSASYTDLPPGAHSLLLIPPGSLKYGWSSEPQEYALPVTPRRGPATPRGQPSPSSRAAASAAARSAFSVREAGHTDVDSPNSVQTSGQSFADSEGAEPQSPAPKKTRRGKRAGKNQKLRAEQASLRASMDGGSLSLGGKDFQRMGSLQSVASSFTSRADEQHWWRTDTPRQSLDLSSLAGSSATMAMPARRASMSATAPPFVPANLGGISRQSVPAVRARVSALNFSGPHPRAPACLESHAFVVGPRRSASHLPQEQRPAVSPFEGVPHSGAGKADAAWNEENPPLTHPSGNRPPASASGSGTSGTEPNPNPTAAAVTEGPTPPSSASGGDSAEKVGTSGMTVSLPRLVTPGAGIPRGASPRGGSPRGASPGGSPHKPPRAPGKATLKHLFKAMTSKRPSQVDLRADAGTDAAFSKSRSRSASHGNLSGLGLAAADVPSSGHASGSESSSSGIHKAGHRKAKHPKQPTSRDNEEAFMLSNLKISDPEGNPPAATSWLARTTRSIFGKSKSCNDLRDLQLPLATQVS